MTMQQLEDFIREKEKEVSHFVIDDLFNVLIRALTALIYV